MSTRLLNVSTPIVNLSASHRFITDCMIAVGCPKGNAEAIAEVLVEADYRGHYSHGMNRLDMYVKDVQDGLCDGKATPEILKEGPCTAWVDGKNGLGAVVGNFCMDVAIKKAKQVGIGWVVAKQSNHYGIAGWYAMMAVKEGLLGMSCTNTSPLMAPTRAKSSALGTNPISLAAPGGENNNFVLDMATTAVAVGKIEMQKRKNQPIEEGWALDGSGHITTDANAAFEAKMLMPLGGAETSSGYKGFGLGMLVEIFSGILSDSKYGPNIRSWGDSSRIADLGHSFVAIDPDCFAPGFESRMADLMNTIRNMEPTDPEKPVVVAGDPEALHMKAVDEAGGVKYVPNQHQTCEKLSKELNVAPLLS